MASYEFLILNGNHFFVHVNWLALICDVVAKLVNSENGFRQPISLSQLQLSTKWLTGNLAVDAVKGAVRAENKL